MLEQSIPIHQAARQCGVTVRTLERWLEEAGIRVPHLGKRRTRYVETSLVRAVLRQRTACREWALAERPV